MTYYKNAKYGKQRRLSLTQCVGFLNERAAVPRRGSGSTNWKSGTQEPGALCIAGLNKYLWNNGAWTSFLINKFKALQKYLGVYIVLYFPMDTRQRRQHGPLRRWQARKGVSPLPSLLWVPRHSWPRRPPLFFPGWGQLSPTFSLNSLQPAFPPSGQPPNSLQPDLSFIHSIISTYVLWFLKLPFSQ